MKKAINVVGAIIENENHEILCALRSPKMSIPNMWEFPGGKIEENEDIQTAIQREIFEELGCHIRYCSTFNDNSHDYGDFIVHLVTVKCKLTKGKPIAKEHSKLIWLKRENLLSLHWAPADILAVEYLSKEKISGTSN